jgi:serine/threonine protein kinase
MSRTLLGITDTQTIELDAPNLGSDSRDVNLNGDDSTAETFSLSIGDDDTSEYTATVESDEHPKSRNGMTVKYAAPEQFSDSASTDKRTDIYQLGVVFYELFTGQPPFEGEMFAVMDQIKTETPTPPSAIADVPDRLDEILLWALAKNPEERYSDIVYLRDDLRDLLEEFK